MFKASVSKVLLFLFGQSTVIYAMALCIFSIKLPLISRLPLCFVSFSVRVWWLSPTGRYFSVTFCSKGSLVSCWVGVLKASLLTVSSYPRHPKMMSSYKNVHLISCCFASQCLIDGYHIFPWQKPWLGWLTSCHRLHPVWNESLLWWVLDKHTVAFLHLWPWPRTSWVKYLPWKEMVFLALHC